MSAFDNIDRTDVEPAGHLISSADYLNASARPEAARVRDLVDGFLEQYPIANRASLIGRIRSRDNRLHRSAWFELLLHGLMLARGFTIIEIEPALPGGRSPDFLVAAPDSREFYLEATVAEGEIGTDPGAHRRMLEVTQAIDQVCSANFFLSLHTRGRPTAPMRHRRLRDQVQRFVDGLDYDAVVEDLANNRPSPIFKFEELGLTLRIEVVPKNVRQVGGRAIGGRILPGRVIQPNLPIKAAVASKASRYGQLDRPYIVAVSALDVFADADDTVDALFGTDRPSIDDGEQHWARNRDGVWLGAGGPAHTRVSAVLSTERLSAWDVGQRKMRLIHNPWASRPILDLPLDVEVCQVIDGRLTITPGRSLAEIFRLPPDWPEQPRRLVDRII